MAFNIADALRTQNADPLGAFLRGHQSGLAAAQARDSAARDRDRIALQAVAQAEAAKSNNFSQMMDRQKLAQNDQQFNMSYALKQQELKDNQELQSFQKRLLNRGVNPRTGQNYSAKSAYPHSYRADGTPSDSETSEPASADAASGEGYLDTETTNAPEAGLFPESPYSATGGMSTGADSELPSGTGGAGPTPVDNPPGSPPAEIPRAEVVPENVAPPAAATTSDIMDRYASNAAPSRAATLAQKAPPLPPPPAISSGMDEILQRQKAEQASIDARSAELGSKLKPVADLLSRAHDLAKSPNQSPGDQKYNVDLAQKQAEILGRYAPEVEALKKQKDEAIAKTKMTEAQAAVVQNLDGLEAVLPAASVESLRKDALVQKPNKYVQDRLEVMSAYNSLRQESGWTYPSNGIATATALVRAYDRVTNPTAALLASQEAAQQIPELQGLITKNKADLALAGKSSANAPLEDELKIQQTKLAKLMDEAQLYKGAVTAFDTAKANDDRSGKSKEKPKADASVVDTGAPPIKFWETRN